MRKWPQLTSLILTILILGMVFIPAVSAENTIDTKDECESYQIEGLDANKVAELEARIVYQQSLPEAIQQAPYRPMISADAETQQAILNHIDNFSISNKEKKEMKKEILDIWSRVPDKITKDDYPTLTKIGNALEIYLGETYWNEDDTEDMSIKWSGTGTHNVHGDLIYYGVMKAYNNANWATTTKTYANNPDNGTLDPEPFYRYYNHYYNPSLMTGGAPNRCTNFALIAKNNYASNKNLAFYNLGLASHYISDVGNPMHTAGEWNQYWNSQPHLAFESYVSSNWNTGYNYKSIVSSNTASQTVTNPATATSNLASFSHQYFDTLWSEIIANPTSFGSDIDVRYITTKVIRETAKYNRGLATYIST